MSTSFPLRISKRNAAPPVPLAVNGLAYRETSIASLPSHASPQLCNRSKLSRVRSSALPTVTTENKATDTNQEDEEEEAREPLLPIHARSPPSVPPPRPLSPSSGPTRAADRNTYKSHTLPGASGLQGCNDLKSTETTYRPASDYSSATHLNLYSIPVVRRDRSAESSSEENRTVAMNFFNAPGSGSGCGAGRQNQNESAFTRNCSERTSGHKLVPVMDKLKEVPKYPLDPNNYATRKTVAQGIMTIALMTANASQMKYVLLSGDQHRFFSVTVALITFSIVLEVIAGIMLIYLAKWNINYAGHQKRAEVVNNFIIITLFLITVVNVLISAFGPVNASIAGHDQSGSGSSSNSWNVYPPTFKLDEPIAPAPIASTTSS